MRQKEPVKGNPPVKDHPAAREQSLAPHPNDGVLTGYVEESLDAESTEHVRIHLVDCDKCYLGVRAREDVAALVDVDDPAGEEVGAVVFALGALPIARKGAGKRSPPGPWLEEGPYRLAIERSSRKELLLRLRQGKRPLGHVLAVLEPAAQGVASRLAWGVTDARGETTLKLSEPTPPSEGRYRVRVLVVSGDA